MANQTEQEANPPEYPVSDKIEVVDGEDIYKTGQWWKAFLVYQYESAEDTDDLHRAVYLWHNDEDEWKRKQKYLVRSLETWSTDRERIEEFLDVDSGDPATYEFDQDELPVSDYYTVGDAVTVFKTDEWWKSIVRVDAKGDWETREVVIYVWQKSDGEWRRRQKYAIKRVSDWEDESEIISEQLQFASSDEEDVAKQEKNFDPEKAKKELQESLKRSHLGEDIQ